MLHIAQREKWKMCLLPNTDVDATNKVHSLTWAGMLRLCGVHLNPLQDPKYTVFETFSFKFAMIMTSKKKKRQNQYMNKIK